MAEKDLSKVDDLMEVISLAMVGQTDQGEVISKNMDSAISHLDAAAAKARKKSTIKQALKAAKDIMQAAANAFPGTDCYGGKK